MYSIMFTIILSLFFLTFLLLFRVKSVQNYVKRQSVVLFIVVPCYRLNSFGRRCFAVAGRSTWNSLPDSLHDPAPSLKMFRRQLKTYFFEKYWRDVGLLSALEIFW